MSSIGSGQRSFNTTGKSIQDADAFLARAAKDGANVYGRQQGDDIVLYTKPGTTARQVVRDKISGAIANLLGREVSGSHFSTKQALGREGLQRLVDNHQTHTSQTLTQSGGNVVQKLFANVRQELSGSGSLSASDARGALARHADLGVEQRTTNLPLDAAIGPTPKADTTPRLSALSRPAVSAAIASAAAVLLGKADLKAARDTLATTLSSAVTVATLNKGDAFAMAMSDQTQLAEDLTAAIKANLARADPNHRVSDKAIKALVSGALKGAREETLGAKVGDGEVKLSRVKGMGPDENGANPISLRPITVGDKTYEPSKWLAKGGFGEVVEFKAQDGSKLVMKLALKEYDSETALALTKDEVAAHLAAQGNGNANIVTLHGVAEMPGGRFGIILDHAPNGSVEDLAADLHGGNGVAPDGQAPTTGQVTKSEARMIALALVADMARGTRHMHETQGVTNFDMKTANALLDAQGNALLSDFGTSKTTATTRVADAPEIDAIAFKAPEFGAATVEIRTIQNRAITDFGLFDDLDSKTKSMLETDLRGVEVERFKHATSLTQKVDTWSIGVSLMQLATGRTPMDHLGWNSHKEEAVVAFGQGNRPAVASDPNDPSKPADGSLIRATGDTDLDALANQMMQADPTNRPDLGTVLQHPAMQRPELQLPELRSLVVAIRSRDPAAIDAARAALDTAITNLSQQPQPQVPSGSGQTVPSFGNLPFMRTSVDLTDHDPSQSSLPPSHVNKPLPTPPQSPPSNATRPVPVTPQFTRANPPPLPTRPPPQPPVSSNASRPMPVTPQFTRANPPPIPTRPPPQPPVSTGGTAVRDDLMNQVADQRFGTVIQG